MFQHHHRVLVPDILLGDHLGYVIDRNLIVVFTRLVLGYGGIGVDAGVRLCIR